MLPKFLSDAAKRPPNAISSHEESRRSSHHAESLSKVAGSILGMNNDAEFLLRTLLRLCSLDSTSYMRPAVGIEKVVGYSIDRVW